MSAEQLGVIPIANGQRFIDSIDLKFAGATAQPGREHEEVLYLRRDETATAEWMSSTAILLQRPKPEEIPDATDEWRRFGGYRLTVVFGVFSEIRQMDYVVGLDEKDQPQIYRRKVMRQFFTEDRLSAKERQTLIPGQVNRGQVLGNLAIKHGNTAGKQEYSEAFDREKTEAILQWIAQAQLDKMHY